MMIDTTTGMMIDVMIDAIAMMTTTTMMMIIAAAIGGISKKVILLGVENAQKLP
jgi:hypothetical protein